MPHPPLNLDNRTFADLVAEGRALIPRYAPAWTNHNASDPGITLLDLLAWLTEMLLYRLNQVPDRHYRAFLDLIGVTVRADETTQAAISRAIRALGARSRAVSPADFEHLARHVASRGYDTGLADKILAGTARLEDFEVLAADAPSDVIVRARALAD